MKKLFIILSAVCLTAGAFARTWTPELQTRAESGNAEAQAELGYCYFAGKGVDRNDEEAAKWLAKAATQGDKTAEATLRNLSLLSGYLNYAEGGDPQYQVAMGLMYRWEGGIGLPQDFQEAVRWYRLAAEKGDRNGQYSLGYMYEMGYGVGQNNAEAAGWYRKAADQGDVQAMYKLGTSYYKGEPLTGEEKDPVAARKFLEQYVNAFRDADGRITVKKKDMQAVMSDALRMLQALYRFGRGTSVDLDKANSLLKEASAFGSPDAAAISRIMNGR